jgi:hypothetical protein
METSLRNYRHFTLRYLSVMRLCGEVYFIEVLPLLLFPTAKLNFSTEAKPSIKVIIFENR